MSGAYVSEERSWSDTLWHVADMAGRTWQQSLPLGGEGGYPVWVGGTGWKLILGGLISYQGNQEMGWG